MNDEAPEGTAGLHWKKLGRVFAPSGEFSWASSHAALPIAWTRDGGSVCVYFSARDHGGRSHVGHIELDMGDPLRPVAPCPVPDIVPGPPGTFDDAGVTGSWLVEQAGLMYLYYVGWNVGTAVPFRNSLGLAISDDGGATFRKVSPGPIMDRSIHDPSLVASCCVMVDEGRWKMWYTSGVAWGTRGGVQVPYYHIKFASSLDGITWERDGTVCIDFRHVDEHAISRPCVVRDGSIYRMWYSYRGERYRLGYAESIDGLRWDRKDGEVGIESSSVGWDSEMIAYSFVFDHEGERYLLYNGNEYGRTGFGLAVLES